MQEAFVNINNIPTKVLSYGRWITEKPDSNEDKIILLIPGNPGITGFYKTFMKYLYEKHKCPVWAIAHTGHEFHRDQEKSSELVGLREQIEQKVSFIEEYVPKSAKLHVLGHSIGGYITLELLKESRIEKRIAQTYLLFPTLEEMKITKNGNFLYTYVRPIVPIVIFFSWLFSVLPKIISVNILVAYMWLTNLPKAHRSNISGLINPKVLQQIFFLAYQELEQVKARDDENINNNLHRINILFGAEDGWCFPTSSDDIKKKFPNIHVKVTKSDHSFVLHDNEEVANVVSTMMMNN